MTPPLAASESRDAHMCHASCALSVMRRRSRKGKHQAYQSPRRPAPDEYCSILSAYGMEQRITQQARERAAKAAALTPQHAAAEAAMESRDDDEDQAAGARRRIQHEADPHPPDVPEVVHADLDELYRQGAVSTPEGYPPFSHVTPRRPAGARSPRARQHTAPATPRRPGRCPFPRRH